MLIVSSLEKSYPADGGDVRAVQRVSFRVETGQFYTLLGPSGCGKTTTLHCVAGLETPDAGEIVMDGEIVLSSARRINVPPHRRNLGMVFQSYAIWPHMTVFENVAFPLVHGHGRGLVRDVPGRVLEALSMVKLDRLADRPAPFLSGGQQQRVALARALVHQPRLLLFDEPLSNLDAKLREEMRVEIRQLTETLGMTTIYVTHDQVEALSMSDVIAVMRDGCIVQEGPPREVYLWPRNAFAADFMGGSNIIEGAVLEGPDSGMVGLVDTPIGHLRCSMPAGMCPGSAVQILVRPESIRPSNDTIMRPNVFDGHVEHVSFVGESIEAQVRIGNHMLRVKLDPFTECQPQQPIRLEIPSERCVAIRPTESMRVA